MEIRNTINFTGPFRLATALNIIAKPGQNRRRTNRVTLHNFSIEVPGGAIEIRMRQNTPNTPINVLFTGDDVNDETAKLAESTVRRIFSLNYDANEFYDLAIKDSHLRFALSINPDLRPVLYDSPFEGAIFNILSKYFSVSHCYQIMQNIREVGGIVPKGRIHATPAFPGKLTFLGIPDRLLEITGIGPEYLPKVKDFVASLFSDPDPLDEIWDIENTIEARQKLLALPEMCPKCVDHMLMRAYGFNNYIFPSPHLFNAVKRVFKMNTQPDFKTVLRLADDYQPWRTWWMYAMMAADETSVIV